MGCRPEGELLLVELMDSGEDIVSAGGHLSGDRGGELKVMVGGLNGSLHWVVMSTWQWERQ